MYLFIIVVCINNNFSVVNTYFCTERVAIHKRKHLEAFYERYHHAGNLKITKKDIKKFKIGNYMKIGIVTQPLNGNFGGIMQNYALQTILKELGHLPITLDFVQSVPFTLFLLSRCKTFLKRIFLRKKLPFIHRIKKRRDIKGDFFITKYINKTEYLTKYNPNIIEIYNLDAIIVGSDQVWRPSYNSSLKDMYLNFAKKYNIKKIAFAASFGVSNKEYSEKEIELCLSLIRQFEGISVREKSGIDLCASYFDINASWLLDPTFLLPLEHYLNLISNITPDMNEFIGVYILDQSKEKLDIIEIIKKNIRCSNVKMISNAQADTSVEEWLATFRDAKFIITDSFHGTVFSIIFNKPFIVIPNQSRGLDRFTSLLEYFSLEKTLCNGKNCVPNMDLYNWSTVDKAIQSNREKALAFLQQTLN